MWFPRGIPTDNSTLRNNSLRQIVFATEKIAEHRTTPRASSLWQLKSKDTFLLTLPVGCGAFEVGRGTFITNRQWGATVHFVGFIEHVCLFILLFLQNTLLYTLVSYILSPNHPPTRGRGVGCSQRSVYNMYIPVDRLKAYQNPAVVCFCLIPYLSLSLPL